MAARDFCVQGALPIQRNETSIVETYFLTSGLLRYHLSVNSSTKSLAGSICQPAPSQRIHKPALNPQLRRIFLLSPANPGGIRARLITRNHAESELATQLRRNGAPLGELFSFISGLYFRGKLAYARAFATMQAEMPSTFVITSCLGLLPPETLVTLKQLRQISLVPVEPSDARYRVPLERDGRMLSERIGEECEVVLLGSIATPKYLEPLAGIFGERLVFPAEFVGRGDMSRGGLMLRCVRAGAQLTYVSAAEAVRHGRRPPKLPSLGSRGGDEKDQQWNR